LLGLKSSMGEMQGKKLMGKKLMGKNLMQKKLRRWEKKKRKNGPKNFRSKVGGRLMITP
jgi:hypothetical protein